MKKLAMFLGCGLIAFAIGCGDTTKPIDKPPSGEKAGKESAMPAGMTPPPSTPLQGAPPKTGEDGAKTGDDKPDADKPAEKAKEGDSEEKK